MVSGREVGFRVMFLGGNVFLGFCKNTYIYAKFLRRSVKNLDFFVIWNGVSDYAQRLRRSFSSLQCNRETQK